jgi:uncharacterized protein YebE (UPF0316 family)
METTFFHSFGFTYVFLPLLIFMARIGDVTLDTVRIIMVSKGKKTIAPVLGFFEVLIWILAITRIMQNLDNWMCYVAYALGFATGNYIGLLVEEKLAVGTLLIRLITQRDATDLIESLRQQGFSTTSVPATGNNQMVHILFLVVNRSALDEVVAMIQNFNPNAFYTVEDVRYVSQDVLPLREARTLLPINPFKWRSRGL